MVQVIYLPNADLFVAMSVNKEAVLSSQIEGTQASLIDVLAFEADAAFHENPQDIEEVVIGGTRGAKDTVAPQRS